MFRGLRLRGGAATLLFGAREAAVLSTWAIGKREGDWILAGTITRVDTFLVRRSGLLFTAPRAGGYWAWAVLSVDVVGTHVRAKLGPPEQ